LLSSEIQAIGLDAANSFGKHDPSRGPRDASINYNSSVDLSAQSPLGTYQMHHATSLVMHDDSPMRKNALSKLATIPLAHIQSYSSIDAQSISDNPHLTKALISASNKSIEIEAKPSQQIPALPLDWTFKKVERNEGKTRNAPVMRSLDGSALSHLSPIPSLTVRQPPGYRSINRSTVQATNPREASLTLLE